MLLSLLVRLIDVYSLIVFAGVIVSWIPSARNTSFARWLSAATDPVLDRIRRVIPPAGGFDLSPMVLLLGLQLLKSLLLSAA